MNEGTLKNIVLSLVFLVPFIGLIVSSSFFFPFITPKNLAFRLLVLLGSITYALLLYRSKNYRQSFGTIGWSILVFILILFVADIFGQYAHKSFFSNFERMEGFFTLLLLFFYYIVLSGVMKTERLWENLFNISLASSVIMSIYALVEKSTGVGRLAAQLGNSTYLGIFMLFNMFFAITLIIRRINKVDTKSGKLGKSNNYWAILIYIAIFLLDFYIFYYTGTRGALLGLFAGVIFTAVMFSFFEKHDRKLKYTGYFILIVAVISIGTLFSIRNTDYVKNSPLLARFSELIAAPTDLSKYATTQGGARFAIWEIALKGVKERPVLGWGQENFNYVFNKYYDPHIYDQEQWFDRAHNVFLDWLIAGGVTGLISYLSIFFFTIFSIWRKKRQDESHHFNFADKTLFTALLIAYFIHNFFVFDSITSYILFFTVIAYVGFHEKKLEISNRFKFAFMKKEGVQALLTTVFVILSVGGIYYLVISPFITSRTLLAAISLENAALDPKANITLEQRNQALQESLNKFQTAAAYGAVTGGAEVNEQLANTQNLINAQGISDYVKKAFITETDSQFKEQLIKTPEDARYFLFYGMYLANTGRFDDSYQYFKSAEELSPNKQTILLSEGSAYLNNKQFDEALPFFKKAFELDENNVDARIFYIVGSIFVKDDATVQVLIDPIRNTDQGTDIRIIRAYFLSGLQSKVTELLLVKLNLAKELAAKGDKQGAIKEVEEVEAISPAFKKQGDALIVQFQSM